MIGNGKNKKSMAYIENVVAFIEACITSNEKYGLYNYVDSPDMTMNELVSLARLTLKHKTGTGIRIPYWFGLLAGYGADLISQLSDINLPISSIRVKKFVSSTEFNCAANKMGNFVPPFHLKQGIESTLKSEFTSPDPNREIFYTE